MSLPTASLTPRQQTFALEYLKDSNGKQAAIRAGYSPATAESQASRLLSNVKVKAFLDAARQRAAERAEISRAGILNRLHAIGMEDPAGPTQVRALELVGKDLGMFQERHEVEIVVLTPEQRAQRVAELLATARERRALGSGGVDVLSVAASDDEVDR